MSFGPAAGSFYVLAIEATAASLQASVDAEQGYPKAGVNVGGGIHMSGPFVTQTHAFPLQHPTLAEWAYPADGVTVPIVGATIGLPAPSALDATWIGATAVGETAQVVA
jgi:hypothetical protein